MKLLIDECLHVSLVELAQAGGHIAYHVNFLGLGSWKDWQLIGIVVEQDYTFVTNNRADFLALYSREPLHAGLVILIPKAPPKLQRELFSAALEHVGSHDLTNTVIEADYVGNRIECREYRLPPDK